MLHQFKMPTEHHHLESLLLPWLDTILNELKENTNSLSGSARVLNSGSPFWLFMQGKTPPSAASWYPLLHQGCQGVHWDAHFINHKGLAQVLWQHQTRANLIASFREAMGGWARRKKQRENEEGGKKGRERKKRKWECRLPSKPIFHPDLTPALLGKTSLWLKWSSTCLLCTQL